MASVGVIEKALIFLVRPEFLLNMRGAQGGKVQAREVMGYIEDNNQQGADDVHRQLPHRAVRCVCMCVCVCVCPFERLSGRARR